VRLFANTSILIKALLIIAVPLIMLSLLMVNDIQHGLKDRTTMQTMLQAADLSETAANLVHELQKERGMSAGLLGSGGKKFTDKLARQQRAVDLAFSAFKAKAKKGRLFFDAFPRLRHIRLHLIQKMKALKATRQNIGKLNMTVDDEMTHYTDMVDDLMRISNIIRIIYVFGEDSNHMQKDARLIKPNARFSGLLLNFISLERAKEAAGIERAVLSNTFALDHFGAGMYERFVNLVYEQRHTLAEFSRQSPLLINQIFLSRYSGNVLTEVEQFRTIAMKNAKNGDFGVEPEQWFRVSSQRMALLYRVENEILALIRQYSNQGVEQADNHIRDTFIRWLMAILLTTGLSMWAIWQLLLGIRRINHAVQSIEAGVYDIPIGITNNDEVGRMLESVEQMRLSLIATEQARDEQEKKAQARLEALLYAKDELYKEHRLIDRLLDAMPSILIAVDCKKNISLWNSVAEKTFGLKSADVVGSAFSELGIEWDREEIHRNMIESEALYMCKLERIRFTRSDGSDGFLGLTINAIIEDGNNNAFLLIGSDITEQLQLERQLQVGQKLESMGELAAGIAHEINTPMQYIGDNVRFLKDGFADFLQLISSYRQTIQEVDISEQRQCEIRQAEADADIDFLHDEIPTAVSQTLEGVAHVSKIVAAMKELSHPGTGGKMPIDINKVIENTVTVSRSEWKYIADLNMTLDPQLPMIHALPEINQVFLNIIINAAHAIEDVQQTSDKNKGEIHISTTCIRDMVEIRISDSGSGIDRDKQDKIFDPFFTTKAPGKGTGQGLAISHQIVCNRLDGKLFVESEPGHGTSFIIQLPVGKTI